MIVNTQPIWPADTPVATQDVEAARCEANDIVKFLKPLRRYFEKLNMMDDFTALVDLFKPIMHTMLLVWKHSQYYNTAVHFVTLIREVCNDLIMQVSNTGYWFE
jgi:dynein heavy chain, axonemal